MAWRPALRDPERRRVIAARGALVIDQALGLEAAEDLVDGTALDLEASRAAAGPAPSSRCEAALRMTAWVSLSFVMG